MDDRKFNLTDNVSKYNPDVDPNDYVRYTQNGSNGWVHKQAKIDDAVSIGTGSVIGVADIRANVTIGEYCHIQHGCFIGIGAGIWHASFISNSSFIHAYAQIGPFCHIGVGVRIEHMAVLGNRVRVGDYACIPQDTLIASRAEIGVGYTGPILTIHGSRHNITVCAPTRNVQIGCQRHSIDDWLKIAPAVGEEFQYLEREIQEYQLYLQVIEKWCDLYLPKETKG